MFPETMDFFADFNEDFTEGQDLMSGSRTWKRDPLPTVLSISMEPPSASVSHRAIDKPSPTPPNSRDLALSAR
jgi:hypothetical protein